MQTVSTGNELHAEVITKIICDILPGLANYEAEKYRPVMGVLIYLVCAF